MTIMRKTFTIASMFLPLLVCSGQTLNMKFPLLNKENIYGPIYEIGYFFDTAVGIEEGATLSILNGDDTLLTSSLGVDNYFGATASEGYVMAQYPEALRLPQGETYTIVIEPGLIYSLEDPSVKNDRISQIINVPETLAVRQPTFHAEKPVVQSDGMGVYFFTETEGVEDGKMYFLREGVKVREYPCEVSWDWDLGFAGVYFREILKFEEGVHYTMVIPQGVVTALDRPDIINEEIVVPFIGGWSDPLPKPLPDSWRADGTSATGALQVSITYSQGVTLLENPLLFLTDPTGTTVLSLAVPTVEEKEGEWIVKAEFPDVAANAVEEYTVRIPECTVTFLKGNMVVNEQNLLTLDMSGVRPISADSPCTEHLLYDLHGRRVTATVPGSVYIRDGKKFVAK